MSAPIMKSNRGKAPRSCQSMNQGLIAQLDHLIQQNQHMIVRPSTLIEAVSLYKRYRLCYGIIRNRAFSRKVLYFVLERMFWSQFENSRCIGIFLNFLHEIDGNLSTVMLPETGKCPSFEHVEPHMLFTYFARHAFEQKLLFDGYRLPCCEVYACDVWQHPVEMALGTLNPMLLHQMLRYGALMSFDKNYQDASKRRFRHGSTGVRVIRSTLTDILGLNPDLLNAGDLVLKNEDMIRYGSLVCCCKLLLRDFPQCTLSSIGGIRVGRGKRKVEQFAEAFSANVVPGFRSHFTSPMDLKQVCRLAIRRALNSDFNLPRGIYMLPIPNMLKEYLDLYH